ncbi:Spx/MgsR family RNA polymerase-binding regulatory protein [Guggenheimella bovis]
MIFICYERCTTCKRIEKELLDKGYKLEKRDIKAQRPTRDELKKWLEQSKLPIKRFFNTSGTLYREMGLKEKLEDMSQDEKLDLLASDGMLVKRPILITDEEIYVGQDVKKVLR